MRLGKWGVLGAVVILVVLFCIPFYTAPKDSEFGGTDASVTEFLEEQGAEPWFQPIAPPAGGEIESGLFAMQAAIGSGIFFYALGRLSGKRRAEKELNQAPLEG
ncbi:energy-coupling factor ABC transporter substrate-binding protein [Arachnia propionica]|uniref:Cobalt transport protein CbiN n=1 Tax=Arachnia propionica TaxID=1750 RepID=A0A3P1X074_9ACTN|nr:energy-coupling factor ABC transporter substrate-binding protein [Arachnia propionica]RRD51367.1 energy-coupling factor ABC transporter substrate-binding protein [Arachnia propionica]